MIIDKYPIITLIRAAASINDIMQYLVELTLVNELCEIIILSLDKVYKGREDLAEIAIFEFAEWVEDINQLPPRPGHETAFDWEVLALYVLSIVKQLEPIFYNPHWKDYEIEGIIHLNNRLTKVLFVRLTNQYEM